MSEQSDITKAVMTEGDWYIVPAEYVNDWISFDRSSVIVHKCSAWEGYLNGGIIGPMTYWTRPESLKTRCNLCDMHVPEAIASLWVLHNFDDFAGEDHTYRLISETSRDPNNIGQFYSTWPRSARCASRETEYE
jgi:hypothetical protein